MRTTVNIEDSLLEEIKKVGLHRKVSISTVINDTLKQGLYASDSTSKPTAEKPLKTFMGDGLQPGVDLNDGASLLDLMESS
ncbi:MAG: hypothetical protein MK080_10880 [Opitutales bacterium]|nr:hypothetical protein [Opitutales bacterium]